MIRIEIPNRSIIELQHAVFDVNGTLAVDGVPIPGVVESLNELRAHLSIYALTAGTHANLEMLEQAFGFPPQIISTGEEKAHFVQQLGPSNVIAIGNGANDAAMLEQATIGIAVLATEGIAISALRAADILVTSPLDAIGLILNPKRLVATLRG